MITTTLKGTYFNGVFELEKPIDFKEKMEIVVVFLKPEKVKENDIKKFSVRKSLAFTKDFNLNISETIIEERRNEKIFFNKKEN